MLKLFSLVLLNSGEQRLFLKCEMNTTRQRVFLFNFRIYVDLLCVDAGAEFKV